MTKFEDSFESSEFGKLKLVDLFNSVYFAMLTLIDNVLVALEKQELPSLYDLKYNLGIFIALILIKWLSKNKK